MTAGRGRHWWPEGNQNDLAASLIANHLINGISSKASLTLIEVHRLPVARSGLNERDGLMEYQGDWLPLMPPTWQGDMLE